MPTSPEILREKLIEYRRELHEHPELSMLEFETTKRIKIWLTEAGVKILNLPISTGLVAEIEGKLPGPVIMLRADIDALPVSEQTDLPYRSQTEGVMHACGHDFHAAGMIGAAILLNERKSKLKGTVRVLFQPSEEEASGARWMVQHGALDGVQAIFGFHNQPYLPVGTVGVRPGALMASVDRFLITVTGTGGHAGMPQNCIDPTVIASQIVLALQSIVSRRLNSFDNAVISVTRFTSGNTWNVIPEQAELEGTVRTFQTEARAKIPQLMKQISEGIASAMGARVEFVWRDCISMVNNDARFTEVVKATAQDQGLMVAEGKQVLVGEDFAYFQEMIPGFFVWIGVDSEHELHSPFYNPDEDALFGAASYFAKLAENVLKNWEIF